MGAMLGGFVSAEPRLGGMPLVPDGRGTVRPVSDVAGDVPEGGGTSFGAWVHAIWRGGEGPVWCHPPLLEVPPGVWKHTGGPWGRPRERGGGAKVDGHTGRVVGTYTMA